MKFWRNNWCLHNWRCRKPRLKEPFKYYVSKRMDGVKKWQFLLIYSSIYADVCRWAWKSQNHADVMLEWSLKLAFGAFNNYGDKILPNFAPTPPVDKKWTFYKLFSLSHVTPIGFLLKSTPSSCPRSYWMTPYYNLVIRLVF